MPKTTKKNQPNPVGKPNPNPICPVQCTQCGLWMYRIIGKGGDVLWTCDCGCKVTEDVLLSRVAKLLSELIDDVSMIGSGAPLNLLPIATIQPPLSESDKLLDCFEFDEAKVKKFLPYISDSAHTYKAKTVNEADAIAQYLSVIFGMTVDRIQTGDGIFRLMLRNDKSVSIYDNDRDPSIEERMRLWRTQSR